jgi:hypothetical protein
MQLLTIIDNLKKTIEGKEGLLADIDHYSGGNRLVSNVTREFLVLNIRELKCILVDLERICSP